MKAEGEGRAEAELISGGEQRILRAARRLFLARRIPSGGKQASIDRVVSGVAIKQFVVHFWTLCQREPILSSIWAVGEKMSPP